MKKLIILSVSLFVICLQSNAQHLRDSTRHYLSINDNAVMHVLKQCIEDIYEWNSNNYRKNGIFNIYVSNDDGNSSMRLIHYYPQNKEVGIMPDFYSYVDEQIVFWYMGKSHLSATQNIAFKEFVSNIYAKFAAEPAEIPQPLNNTSQRIERMDISNVPHSLSAEDMKRGIVRPSVSTGYNRLIPVPPTFLINKNKNGRVSVIKEHMIFG